MTMNHFQKWWQRWMLDSLTMDPPPLVILLCTVFGSVFGIGFLCAHWIDQVDLANYKPYSVYADNIGGLKMNLMTDILPVDVVYTWVNGSDPALLKNLQELEEQNKFICNHRNCFKSSYFSIYSSQDESEDMISGSPVPIIKSVQIAKGNIAHKVKVTHFPEVVQFQDIQQKIRSYFGINASIQQAYWTSEEKVDWSVDWKTAAILRLTPDSDVHAELSTVDPEHYKQYMEACSFAKHKDTYVVECPEESLVEQLKAAVTKYNEESNSRYPKIWPANLILFYDSNGSEFYINRFADNEELRYSLRSLEKFAPWVRRVFVITNGQLPYWLNLDHPKVTVITHEQIFSNLSHLPTYSSPAIESHIHRIPGLSNHFLYLNDDVMLGAPIWPEDFYSTSTGYKVYLAWSLPECSSGCPDSWINDGYCDHACNNSACNWDGGDCPGEREAAPSDYFDKGDDDYTAELEYCSSSCADTWLADSYCDSACSNDLCAFDAGDCGADIIKENMFQIIYNNSKDITVNLPRGTLSAWVDLTPLLKQYPDSNTEGTHSALKGLRVAVFNKVLGLVIVVFRSNSSGTLDMELDFMKNNKNREKKIFVFKLTMKIFFNSHPASIEFLKNEMTKFNFTSRIRNFNFTNPSPRILNLDKHKLTLINRHKLSNLTNLNLPRDISYSLELLAEDFRQEILTEEGYNIKKTAILDSYFKNRTNNLKINKFNKKISPYVPDSPQDSVHRKLLYSKRKILVNFDKTLGSYYGKFPWERHKYFPFNREYNSSSESEHSFYGDIYGNDFQHFNEENLIFENGEKFVTPKKFGRRLLDVYADSLLFANRLFNSEYGFEARRVPAHMPHFINKEIFAELHARFPEEFYMTSSHKLRQGNDMQFAFSYFYFLMREKRNKTYIEIFKDFDTDLSGTWSDREIRTFLAKTNPLPLTYNMILDLHKELRNCSEMYNTLPVPTVPYERYADSNLPTVSEELVVKCASSLLYKRLKPLTKVPRFSFSIAPDSVVSFKMITSNLSTVVHHLDDVRKHSKKFICLNSDLDPNGKDNDLIRALVQDAYESLYPIPSSFELPPNYRNRFSHMREVNDWKWWRNIFRALIYASVACLVLITFLTFFKTEIEGVRRRWCRRCRRKDRLFGHRV